MQLNAQLVKLFSDVHEITPIAGSSIHNIFVLRPGLCHASRLSVEVNGEPLPEESFLKLYPSSEFKVRYGMDSVVAVMLLDNTIRGNVVIKCAPIGGVWADVNATAIPKTGTVGDHHGRYLEQVGGVIGLPSYNRRFEDVPSTATDISGTLVGRTSYPGSGDTANVDDLEKRVSKLEGVVYHEDINMPAIKEYTKAFLITERDRPCVQLETASPDPTWYYVPSSSEIELELNPVTGEIVWVDGNVPAGIYGVDVYIMANGIRSETTRILLNVM